MATLQATLDAQTALLQQLLASVQGLSPAKPDDLAPLTTAVNNLQTTVNAVAAKLPIDPVTSAT